MGPWEQFEQIPAGTDRIALRSKANGLIVTAGNGSAPLIADRTSVGTAETFQVIRNSDGSVSLRAVSSGLYVAAEAAGTQPLIANRAAVGDWERFDLNIG